MALDGIFLSFLIEELRQKALGTRVDKIHQPSRTELLFTMRSRSKSFKILFCANADSARVNITSLEFDNPKTPPMLCMLFRKKLGTAVLKDIRQDGLDRVVFFDFSATNELGDKENLTLCVEIMAQHSNIILMEENGKIIDAVKRVDEDKSSYREILPGITYLPPPVQNKLNILSDTSDDILKAVQLSGESDLPQALVRVLSGVSPLTARELCLMTGETPVCGMTEKQWASLRDALMALRRKMTEKEPLPTLVYTSGKPREFSFSDIWQYGLSAEKKRFLTLSELLDAYYSDRDTARRMKARSGALFTFIDNAVERTQRKIMLRGEELEKCKDRERLRVSAELITANQYRLSKGESLYELSNYYDNDAILRIPADPALTPSQNAQKYYREYRKAQTAEKKLTTLIEQSKEEYLYFESVRDALLRASAEAELSQIDDELISQGYKKDKRTRSGKVSKPAKLEPFEYTTSGGLTVLVGRGNTQNDKLTFKLASKTDWWFHVTKAPGSHVILKTDGREPDDASVLEAAALAVRHSSLTGSLKVSVDYTAVKNIKKPTGSRPGFVTYHEYYSLIVG